MPKDEHRKALRLRKEVAETVKAELEVKREKVALKAARDRLADQLKITRNDEAANDRNGVFYFNTGVNGTSVAVCRAFLNRWKRTNPGEPVELVFNSGGGSVFDGLDLGDTIEDMKDKGHHVTTVIAGMSASMAGILVQFGSTRVIGRHSWLHLHEVSSGSMGKASDLEDTADLAKRLTMQACEIYAKRSGRKAKEIHKMMERHEVWLSADQALEYGFVDEIR